MKSRYFEFITIEEKIVRTFLSKHPKLNKFIKFDEPFYVRIYKKPYAGLIHMIISQDEQNENVINLWNQLLDYAKNIKPNNIYKLGKELLSKIVGIKKSNLIWNITNDVINGTLDLKSLMHLPEQNIINTLMHYQNLSMNTIQLFLIFAYFKSDVLCDSDPDFINGVKLFLTKQNMSQDDINNIKIEYKGEQTLFSLCMWKIKNESVR